MKTTFNLALAFAILLSSCQQEPSVKHFIPGDLLTTENLPSTSFEIRGNADTVVTGKSGTKIYIPQNTFIDSYGKPCLGSLTLKLREALNPVDIVLGNMTTLSNGKILQSGGMIYIDAVQGNQSLTIGMGKAITVSVPAVTKLDSMKIYSATFDSTTVQLNWVKPEDRMIKVVKSDTVSIPFLNKTSPQTSHGSLTENSAPISPPVKPGQSGKGDTIISLTFDTLAFPELAQYRNVKFKLVGSSNFSSNDSKTIWHDIQLEKTKTAGIYTMTFTRFNESGNIVRKNKVTPVLSGMDYESAMNEYNSKFARYEQTKKEIETRRIEAERRERLAIEKAAAESKKQQLEARFSGINPFIEDPSVNYVFTLNRLGWANIDCLYNSSKSRPVDLVTRISNEESYESIYISLLFDKEKIFLPGYQKKDHSFGFSHYDSEKTVLPLGASAMLIATAYKDGELHFVSKRITIRNTMNIVLDPLPIKKEELKGILTKNIGGRSDSNAAMITRNEN